jgi:tetratricopeptide (TPR) repeat protein
VDTEKFAEAQSFYAAKDYRKSARLFLESIEKGTPVGNGPAYHMAGNSFMRLKRYSDASVVFEHALRDDTYQRHGSVEANLANAYVRTGDYGAAVAHYEAALAAGETEFAYKYYQGIAHAHMQQEQYKQAALAYKHAALDKNNPAPGKSLLNLGLAMMAAGDAPGAVEAYRAAIANPSYENKGRALLNMGVALHAQGKWREAIRALEEAQVLHGYGDSDLAQRTITDAQQRLAIEAQVEAADEALAAEEAQQAGGAVAPVAEADESVQSFTSMPVVADPQPAGDAAAQIQAQAQAQSDSPAAGTDSFAPLSEDPAFGQPQEVDQFFARSEREAAAVGREKARKQRGRFAWLKVTVLIIAICAVLGGGAAALYYTGQGIPSPRTTVIDLMEAYSKGASISPMWAYAAQNDIERQMVAIPISPDYTINKIETGATRSKVSVTVSLETGAKLDFTFALVREGIGWKIKEVAPDLAEGPDDELYGDSDNSPLYDLVPDQAQ